jgi:succinate dehydrogenase / fumarate reductase cytochrome b subunit
LRIFFTFCHRQIQLFALRYFGEYNHYAVENLSLLLKEKSNVIDTRPKNLNLFTIRLPVPAIISILHRISGFFLFLLIPASLWLLHYSLTEEGFDSIQQSMNNSMMLHAIIWLVLMPFLFHLVAGIRHLLMDIGCGTSLKGGRRSAWLTFIVTFLLVVLAGIWLW